MDLGFGVVASTVANFAGKSMKEGSGQLTPLDFMPLSKRAREEGRRSNLAATVRSFFSSFARRSKSKEK